MNSERVLIVDDEPLLLELYVAQLGNEFEIVTASGGAAALQLLSGQDSLAMIIADMHMPGMSGVAFLQAAQEVSPSSVRIMLTADGDQGVAVDAVNHGSVFRFLKKPCSAEELARSIHAGLEEHRLRCAETRMLASTVNGSINMMGEILSLVSPIAFGKAGRVTRIVEELCRRLAVTDGWELTMAAMLSQLGCISLPDALIPRAARGERLSAPDAELWQSHPRLGHALISKIPRLERVAEIVLLQQSDYRPTATEDVGAAQTVEWRASCLRLALEFDVLIEQQHAPLDALERLRNADSNWPISVLDALDSFIADSSLRNVRSVIVHDLRAGMVLDEHLVAVDGRILLTKGQQIADWLITRLHRLGLVDSIRQPIRIVDPFGHLDLPSPAQSFSIPPSMLVPGSLAGAA